MWKNPHACGPKDSIHSGFTHFFIQILTQDGQELQDNEIKHFSFEKHNMMPSFCLRVNQT
jgi:hypothetical protein